MTASVLKRQCVRVKINKRSFEPFGVWITCVVSLVEEERLDEG